MAPLLSHLENNLLSQYTLSEAVEENAIPAKHKELKKKSDS